MRIISSANPRPLTQLVIGPGGLVAAACGTLGEPGGVEAWDAATGTLKWKLMSDHSGFRCIAFLLGGTHFFAADLGVERLFTLPSAGRPPVEEARISLGGAALAAVGDRVFVGRGGAGAALAAVADRVFVSCGGAVAALTCWGVPDMDLVWSQDGADNNWDRATSFGPSLALAPAGDRLAVSVRTGGTHPGQFISIRDAATGDARTTIPFDPTSPVHELAFTADGSGLLARTGVRTVHVFDAATGGRAGELVHPGRWYVTGIAVHPRGPVACARTDGTVTFWDPGRREPLRVFDWKAGRLMSVAFAPDGALAAAGTEDGKVVVWDVDG